MKAQPIRKWPQALAAAPYCYQMTPRHMQVSCNNLASFLILELKPPLTWQHTPGTTGGIPGTPASAGVPCQSCSTVAHTLDQPAGKIAGTVLIWYALQAHGELLYLSASLCACAPTCVCVCATQRDARLPIDVIIFSFQALISAWLLRYFYYSVCVLS